MHACHSLVCAIFCLEEAKGPLDRGIHAVVAGDPFARDVECSAMIDRRSDEGQTQGHVYRLAKTDQLDRSQSLVVVHRQHYVKLAIECTIEQRVRRQRTFNN